VNYTTHAEMTVEVEYSHQPAEPDVNCAGGVEIESVTFCGMDILAGLSGGSVKDLELEILEHLAGQREAYDEEKAEARMDQRRYTA